LKQKHYQAWQVINSAQAKGGSGGRIDALEELHPTVVPRLVDVSDAFLQGLILAAPTAPRKFFAVLTFAEGSLSKPDWNFRFDSANFGMRIFKGRLEERFFAGCRSEWSGLSDSDLEGANPQKRIAQRPIWAILDGKTYRTSNWADIFWNRMQCPSGF